MIDERQVWEIARDSLRTVAEEYEREVKRRCALFSALASGLTRRTVTVQIGMIAREADGREILGQVSRNGDAFAVTIAPGQSRQGELAALLHECAHILDSRNAFALVEAGRVNEAEKYAEQFVAQILPPFLELLNW